MKYAKKKSGKEKRIVAITSPDKPDIPEELITKRQRILDLAAKLIGVLAGLINRLNEDSLEIFLTSETEGNIFQRQVKLELGLGLYCENVTGTRDQLILPNALKSKKWKDSPSVPFNIISYIGMPIL